MSLFFPSRRKRSREQDERDLLFKGVVLALIGGGILAAPYLARSQSVRELMAGATVVGWFALVLGIAFVAQYLVRRARRARSADTPQPNDR
ncbi:hypothetical protein [Xylophilus sp.]|uniref:hypothetical protein n=1 Tax=Xylophilus sp. TaxID=2653893 RepID=UPI0013B670CC|nr:hypothetical protein [Xylophilus sp.]KAF1048799.1 MAG: hypothetical protein GAK38_01243 [Xylophilus sp.]